MSPHKTIPDSTSTTGSPSSRPLPETWQMGTAAFEQRMPHHESPPPSSSPTTSLTTTITTTTAATNTPKAGNIKALWETRWKAACARSLYPFHDGSYADFAPIFEGLIARGAHDGYAGSWTRGFLSTAEALELDGDAAASEGRIESASALYLRAACVLRIARFPYIAARAPGIGIGIGIGNQGEGEGEGEDKEGDVGRCPIKWRAWTAQKRVYMKAASRWEDPVEEVQIPHIHGRAGHDGPRMLIPAYVRVPTGSRRTSSSSPPSSASSSYRCPTVLLLTGLDGYRPDNTGRSDEFLARGWAVVIVEVPGTADCPADPADPASPDRLWTSVLDWLAGDDRFDARRVVCWGLSAGAYYAVRAAHTHRDRLAGVVAQGAGTHYFFDPAWLVKADGHEYPFRLLPALAAKHGFEDVEEYLRSAMHKFSLLETGILDMPSTRLLLVNGIQDGLMPIEDSMLLFEHGSPKEARFFPSALHMGYPLANASVYPWIENIMASVQ